jgi:hypothetical protein
MNIQREHHSASQALDAADYQFGLDEPLKGLEAISMAALQVDRITEAGVRAAREKGATWEAIGAALGMSKQGAQQRYGDTKGKRRPWGSEK